MEHTLDVVGPAGKRVVARCACGWRTRRALTASLALADLAAHAGATPPQARAPAA